MISEKCSTPTDRRTSPFNYAHYVLTKIGGQLDDGTPIQVHDRRALIDNVYAMMLSHATARQTLTSYARAMNATCLRRAKANETSYEFCGDMNNAFALVGISSPDHDRDGYDMKRDNCDLVFNPIQEKITDCTAPKPDECKAKYGSACGDCTADSNCGYCPTQGCLEIRNASQCDTAKGVFSTDGAACIDDCNEYNLDSCEGGGNFCRICSGRCVNATLFPREKFTECPTQ